MPHARELQLELLLQYCSGTIHSIITAKWKQKKPTQLQHDIKISKKKIPELLFLWLLHQYHYGNSTMYVHIFKEIMKGFILILLPQGYFHSNEKYLCRKQITNTLKKGATQGSDRSSRQLKLSPRLPFSLNLITAG